MAKEQINKLNSQASLEQLASYILRAANQSEILDDTTTTTDQAWSSKKVSDEISELADNIADDYVEKLQGPAYQGLYMRVGTDGNLAAETMTMESQNIDFNNEW